MMSEILSLFVNDFCPPILLLLISQNFKSDAILEKNRESHENIGKPIKTSQYSK